jgi:hypothetical protein
MACSSAVFGGNVQNCTTTKKWTDIFIIKLKHMPHEDNKGRKRRLSNECWEIWKFYDRIGCLAGHFFWVLGSGKLGFHTFLMYLHPVFYPKRDIS